MPRWLAPGAVAFVVVWLLLLAAGPSAFFSDPGTFWHTTTGELILKDGFIRADPYTFTFAGTWWVPYQWLGEVGMALAHRVGGFDTQLLGAVTIIAAVFAWLAARLLRTGLNPVLAGGVIALSLAAAGSHFHVRPHLFTLACHDRRHGAARRNRRRAPALEAAVLARSAVRGVDERPRRRARRNRHGRASRSRGGSCAWRLGRPSPREVVARRWDCSRSSRSGAASARSPALTASTC